MKSGMRRLVLNRTRGTVVCAAASVAQTTVQRMRGLLGSRELAAGTGLWLRPSGGVHTFGMAYAIDIVALDGLFRVVHLWREMKPWRTCGIHLRTRSVLELPVGSVNASQTEIGDQLCFEAGATDVENT